MPGGFGAGVAGADIPDGGETAEGEGKRGEGDDASAEERAGSCWRCLHGLRLLAAAVPVEREVGECCCRENDHDRFRLVAELGVRLQQCGVAIFRRHLRFERFTALRGEERRAGDDNRQPADKPEERWPLRREQHVGEQRDRGDGDADDGQVDEKRMRGNTGYGAEIHAITPESALASSGGHERFGG